MITLATLPDSTAQGVFDHIAKHLLSQGERCAEIDSTDDGPICKYRNSDNQSCAAGCLFGIGEYKSSMEGKNWASLRADGVVPQDHFDLIVQLQQVHDTVPAMNWYNHLLTVAKRWSLDATNLDIYAIQNNYTIQD